MAARHFLPVMLFAVTLPVAADLYISPVVRDTVEYQQSDNGQQILGTSSVHGDFVMNQNVEPGNNLLRYGSNVPLFVALEHLVPGSQAWTVNLDEGLENNVISWEGGSTWEGVLSAIALQNNLSIVMNNDERVVGVAYDEELAKHLAMRIPQVWRLKTDKTLKENLGEWAKQAGWSLSWADDLRIDYMITQNATLMGPFEGQGGVVDRLLGAFGGESVPLSASFYTQNKVIRVTEAGYQ